MKVLFLTPYPPCPPRSGGQIRMYHMLRLLAERHELRLLTLVHADQAGHEHNLDYLRQICRVDAVPAPVHSLGRRLRALLFSPMPDMLLRGKTAAFASRLQSLLASERFDVVQAESIEMAQYGRQDFVPSFERKGTAADRPRFCYDAWNAEYLLQRSAFTADIRAPRRLPAAIYSLVQWRKLHRYEQRLGRQFDLLLAVSEADRQTLARLAPGLPGTVVPNGVDTGFFRRDHALAAPNLPFDPRVPFILFTGTLDFRANVDAVVWFVRSVWGNVHTRRPELRFRVVGQRPAAVRELEREPGVEIVGAVEDVRPWFAHASAYVLPMRVGGGVRLKLLETLAMELPCVTTGLGAQGVEGFVPGTHALVADEPGAFGAALERLLDESATRNEMAAAGRRLVEERYDWQRIVRRMEQAWETHRGMRAAPGEAETRPRIPR